MEVIRLLLVVCNFTSSGTAVDCTSTSYTATTTINECHSYLENELMGNPIASEKGKIAAWGICSPVGEDT